MPLLLSLSLSLLVVVGAPAAITTIIWVVAVVVGDQWLVIKGGRHTIVCRRVPVKWEGVSNKKVGEGEGDIPSLPPSHVVTCGVVKWGEGG